MFYIGNIVALATSAEFLETSKPIHGLENCSRLQFAAVSPVLPVLPTRANTLDRSRHFEPGTFLNKRHYRDV